MKTLYIEGVAIHGGPESCVGVPRGRSEALTGVRVGRAIEPRNDEFGVLTLSQRRKATSPAALCASCWRTLRGQRTRACTSVSMRENREIPYLPIPLIMGWAAQGTPRR